MFTHVFMIFFYKRKVLSAFTFSANSDAKKKTEGKGEKKRGKNTCDNRQLTILITEMAPDPIRCTT